MNKNDLEKWNEVRQKSQISVSSNVYTEQKREGSRVMNLKLFLIMTHNYNLLKLKRKKKSWKQPERKDITLGSHQLQGQQISHLKPRSQKEEAQHVSILCLVTVSSGNEGEVKPCSDEGKLRGFGARKPTLKEQLKEVFQTEEVIAEESSGLQKGKTTRKRKIKVNVICWLHELLNQTWLLKQNYNSMWRGAQCM